VCVHYAQAAAEVAAQAISAGSELLLSAPVEDVDSRFRCLLALGTLAAASAESKSLAADLGLGGGWSKAGQPVVRSAVVVFESVPPVDQTSIFTTWRAHTRERVDQLFWYISSFGCTPQHRLHPESSTHSRCSNDNLDDIKAR
jgi:hypothetical protein